MDRGCAARLELARFRWPEEVALAARAAEPGERLLEVGAYLGRLVGEVNAEQGTADHRQGERRHLPSHVDLLAVAPAVGMTHGGGGERGGVALEPPGRERRRHQPAGPSVVVALAGQQALAEQVAGQLDAGPLDGVGGVAGEQLAGQLRVEHQQHATAPYLESDRGVGPPRQPAQDGPGVLIPAGAPGHQHQPGGADPAPVGAVRAHDPQVQRIEPAKVLFLPWVAV